MNKKLIIFDVDGTLVETTSGATFRKTADDWQWLPGRLERLQELDSQGVTLACATNQGGVAFGYHDEGDMSTQLSQMCNQAKITYLYVCYSHPTASMDGYREEKDLFNRKPMPGMLLQAMLEARVTAPQTLMVGDSEDDEQATKNAGIDFAWAKDFFAEKE